MEKWKNDINKWFQSYCNSFKNISESQKKNFDIKIGHSLRVAALSVDLAQKLDFEEEEQKLAYFIGVLHDVGRFKQLAEFDTFDDLKSVDHAEYSVGIIKEEQLVDKFGFDKEDVVLSAVENHNKIKLPAKLNEEEMKFAKLIRDADKLDILKVLTEYYSNKDVAPNHTLTWDLPKGTTVSPAVVKEVMNGKIVSKKNVESEIDVKIMQMSWVYDFNYVPSIEYLLKHRFLESIYATLPKNDLIIDIHRKIKVYSENKIYDKYNSN